MPLTIAVKSADAASARAERDGKLLPTRVAEGVIYIQAVPSLQPIAVTCK